jgi:hypothetical protein
MRERWWWVGVGGGVCVCAWVWGEGGHSGAFVGTGRSGFWGLTSTAIVRAVHTRRGIEEQVWAYWRMSARRAKSDMPHPCTGMPFQLCPGIVQGSGATVRGRR